MRTCPTPILPCAAAVLTLLLAACGISGSTKAPSADNGDTKPPSACATEATSQACVDEKKTAMDNAKKALDAAKKDRNSTQKQIADVQKAYNDAKKAHDDAVVARNAYLAKQLPAYDLKAMAKAIGAPGTVPVTVSDGTGSAIAGGKVTVDDADGNNTWTEATWPVPKIASWASSVWEKSASPTDSIVVYTNIEAAKGAKYNTYYDPSFDGSRDDDAPAAPAGWSYKAWAGVASVAAQTKDDGQGNQVADTSKPNVITLVDDVTTAADKLFSAAMLPDGDGIGQTYPDGDKTTGDTVEVEFAGTFNGVAGKFSCTSPSEIGCAATNDADGALAVLTGTWTFTADSKDATVAGVLTDADYLDFGYWVQTDDTGDDTVYMANAFYRGTPASGDVSTLEGSATYRGAAAGLYVKRAFSATGDGAVTGAGRFTAAAEFTAHFTGTGVALNDYQSISGMIDNFRDGDQAIDPAWRVELNKIGGIGGTGTYDWNPNAGDTHFSGGTTTGGGSWNGMYYGSVAQSRLPSGVAGEFTAGFNNGEVIGAFGATKTKK